MLWIDRMCCQISPTSKAVASFAACDYCQLWYNEWEYNNELLCDYPGHETLWMYRRFLYAFHLALMTQHTLHCSHSNQQLQLSWCEELMKRELSYAQHCINDVDIANHTENTR